ncbi:MAG: hypothetical protein AAGE52_19010 [Myxococcota bacterium]
MRGLVWVAIFALLACGDDDGGTDAAVGGDSGTDTGADTGTDSGFDAGFDANFDADLPIERELAEYGEHAVGYATRQVTYERPDGEGERELELHIWYPAEASEGPRPRYPFRNSEVGTADGAPLDGPFPVIVFSHGHQGIPDVTTFLMEHFASHGWLALSPEHTGNTTPDGPERLTSIYYLRPRDVSESLTFMENLADDPLAGLVGTPAVISGHSFGGYTAYAVGGALYRDMLAEGCAADELSDPFCSEIDADAEAIFAGGLADDRFDLVIGMASGNIALFQNEGVAAIDVPVLQMVAEGDGNPPGAPGDDPYWAALNGAGDLRVNLIGGDHNSFTDICARVPGFLDCPDNDPLEEQVWLRAYTLAFVRARLFDDAEAAAFLADEPLDSRVEITAP